MASLLDTNIISQPPKEHPDPAIMSWLRSAPPNSTHVSVVSLYEIRYGIERMSRGKKRNAFDAWLREEIPDTFRGRILPVSAQIADTAGALTSRNQRLGAKPDLADALIAATAIVHGLELATLNRKHFAKLGVRLVEFR